jgi:hypothetical protein
MLEDSRNVSVSTLALRNTTSLVVLLMRPTILSYSRATAPYQGPVFAIPLAPAGAKDHFGHEEATNG